MNRAEQEVEKLCKQQLEKLKKICWKIDMPMVQVAEKIWEDNAYLSRVLNWKTKASLWKLVLLVEKFKNLVNNK